MRKLNVKYFYLCYFIINLINTYILTFAIVHPNYSHYSFHFTTFLSSFIGNMGVLLLFHCLSIIFFKKTKRQLNFLMFASFIFMILCVGIATFVNIFSTHFKFSHLISFNNPAQGNFVWFYAKYTLSMFSNFTQFVHFIPFIALVIIRQFIKAENISPHSPIYKSILLLMSIIIMIIPIVKMKMDSKGTIYENSMNANYGISVTGLYDYYFYDYYEYLTRKDKVLTSNELQQIDEFLAYYKQDPYLSPIDNQEYSVHNDFTGKATDKNLVIIQLEAFNNFLINLTVDGQEITPNLNRLANSSLYYDNFYSTTGIGNTSDCEFSALTGLYGNGNDLTIFSYAGNNYETLAKDFRKLDYNTFSLHGNDGKFYVRSKEHLNTLGFNTHYDLNYFKANNPDVPLIHSYLDDKYFLTETAKMLDNQDHYFAYAISVTSHSPYVPTSAILAHHFQGLTKLASSYLDFVMYTDEAIGLFIDEMEQRGLLDDTLIVLYGDHTSSLFKPDLEGIIKKPLSEVEFHQELANVPLVIYNEALFNPTVNHKVGGTVDIYRTMSNLYGLDSKYHFGNDLLSDEPNFIYNPRNLDLIGDDFTIFYPSQELYTNKQIDKNKYINLFTDYKYYNDLILKCRYFQKTS